MQLTLAKVLARKYYQQVVRDQSLNIAFIIADSADPDEIKQNTKLLFQKFRVYKGFIPHYQIS